jgi:hypothetical protein
MKKIKIKGLCCALVLGLSVLLVGCQTAALPDGMTKEDSISKAEEVVTLLNQADYAGVEAICDDTMKAAASGDDLKAALADTISALGAFKSFDQEDVSSAKGYAVAVLKCSYENGSATYTISLDQDYLVGGLYMK